MPLLNDAIVRVDDRPSHHQRSEYGMTWQELGHPILVINSVVLSGCRTINTALTSRSSAGGIIELQAVIIDQY